MLRLANIISHYSASASPSRVSNCTLWTSFTLRVRVRGQSQKNGWAGQEITQYQVGDSGQKGCHSSLVWSLGTGFISKCALVYYFVHCVGGWVHPCAVYCVRVCVDGINSGVEEEVLFQGARCRWCNRWRVVSESQERRWSKLSLSSCSFLLKV